ncbi:MAG: TRAP transporter substrate-binding protein [Alphaproteobacteria bacterium]|nr:TRAP transporter substrate-binding protein [Alphaproteobacteria bacterium]
MFFFARTIAAWLIVLLPFAVAAQTAPDAAPAAASANPQAAINQAIEAAKERANRGVVGIVSGGVDGTYVRIAADLAAVLDGPDLRVLPTLGKGSLQNLTDLVYLRGVDIAIVQSDALAYARRERVVPSDRSIAYIAKLYNEEFHLLASTKVRTIADLAGKQVNFDTRGSGSYLTGTLLFNLLKVNVQPVYFDQQLALEKLRRGEIAALVYVAGKPTRLFRELKPEDGMHFLPVPLAPELIETYLPSRLARDDYPLLIADGAGVETVAVGAVMAVYNWPADSERYRRVKHFIDAFFADFGKFLEAPRHPKWKEVNLAAQVPGWQRFAPADQWLKAAAGRAGASDEQLRANFRAFMSQQSRTAGAAAPTRQQQDELFEQFLRWQAQRPRP